MRKEHGNYTLDGSTRCAAGPEAGRYLVGGEEFLERRQHFVDDVSVEVVECVRDGLAHEQVWNSGLKHSRGPLSLQRHRG